MTDLNDLRALCKDVTRRVGDGAVLYEALHGHPPPPPRYPSLTAARKALHAHPVYYRLQRELPRLIAQAPTYVPTMEFRFIEDLVEHLMIMHGTKHPIESRTRDDKKRQALQKAIDSLLHRLFKDAPDLMPNTCTPLLEALDAARNELQHSRPHRKSVKHPTLYDFAHFFLRRYNLADADMLLDVATLNGLECDERTAQRYIKSALSRRRDK